MPMCPYRRYRIKPKPFGTLHPTGVYIGLLREWAVLGEPGHPVHPCLLDLRKRTREVLES